MKRSLLFWLGILCLFIIPFLALDIPKKVVDYKEEVTDIFYHLIRNEYHLANQQKWRIADQVLHSNVAITTEIWLRGIFSLMLFIAAIVLFIKSRKERKTSLLGSYVIAIVLLAASIGLKILTWYSFSGNERIKLLSLSPSDTTIQNIYNHNFKGKVLYVDFWGTTCPPCISEFLNFTKALKEKYHNQKDIAYLYVCVGHKFVWRQQLTQYDIAGNHIFLESNAYEKMYRQAVGNPKAQVLMPHYLILDKAGKIIVPNAPMPSSGDTIKTQLDKYLGMK